MAKTVAGRLACGGTRLDWTGSDLHFERSDGNPRKRGSRDGISRGAAAIRAMMWPGAALEVIALLLVMRDFVIRRVDQNHQDAPSQGPCVIEIGTGEEPQNKRAPATCGHQIRIPTRRLTSLAPVFKIP